MTNILSIEDCKSYATEENLMKALTRMNLRSYGSADEVPCRFIPARTADGRWTAIFLVSEYMSRNKTGGYIGFASQHGFMSV